MALEDAYELAYREAVRALEHQRARTHRLSSARQRTASQASACAAAKVDLIAHIGFHYRANGRRLAQMSRAFRIGACLLAIQLVLTILAATVTV